jgi:hypothetical protein
MYEHSLAEGVTKAPGQATLIVPETQHEVGQNS